MAANANGYNGFTPCRHYFGGIVRANGYILLNNSGTGYATNIFNGDPVNLGSDGTVQIAAAGDTTMLGTFAGCMYLPANGSMPPQFSPYWPASTAVVSGSVIQCWVYDDPNLTYLVTCDSATAGAQTLVGNNADFVVGTGNTSTGQSGDYLSLVGISSSTANFRILGFPDMPGNVLTNTLVRAEVKFNEHLFLQTTGA